MAKKKKKKKRVDLPEEVINEILLRLPVKTVLRCKCVCKLWLSIISDPHFAISHFQLASSSKHRLLFIESHTPKSLSIDFNASLHNHSAFVSLSLDFLQSFVDFLRPGSRPEIGGYCRGFLFLRCYADFYFWNYSTDFYLWNPSTGVNKRIPVSPITLASRFNANTLNWTYGLGYDLSTDDYKVVVGSYKSGTYPPVFNSIDLEIYSLRANEWEQVEVGSDLPYRNTASYEVGPKVGSFLNGSIHWLVHNHETKRDVIIAFDLKEMTMSEIALPDYFYSDVSHRIYDLLAFGGLISVWNVEMSTNTIKIWVMQEYTMHSSWTKTVDFSLHFGPDFFPVCFTNGGDIVGPSDDGRLVKLNDKGLLLEYHGYGGCYFVRSKMTVYTESLLSLPGCSEQA